jgi:zinc/manganese transport system substrate-binding protein
MSGPVRRRVFPLAAALAVTAPWPAAGLEVVTTTPGLAAIVRELGGPGVRAVSLSRAGDDAHLVSASPVLAARLRDADLLVDMGLGLEAGWLPAAVVLSRNNEIAPGGRRRLSAGDVVAPLDVPAPQDRRRGALHPFGNPHFLGDPRRAADVAAAVARRLALLDPGRASSYAAAAEDFRGRLQAEGLRWKEQLAPFRGAAVVTQHGTLAYLLDWAGLVGAGDLEPEPGLPTSPDHLAALVRLVELRQVRVIASDACRERDAADLLARRSGARQAILPCDAEAAGTYAGWLGGVVSRLAAALRGS